MEEEMNEKQALDHYRAVWSAITCGPGTNVYVDDDGVYFVATAPPWHHWREAAHNPELGDYDPLGSISDYPSADDFAAMCFECFGAPED